MEYLLIHLRQNSAEEFSAEWAMVEGGRRTSIGEAAAPLSTLMQGVPQANAERRIIVLVPGSTLLLTNVQVPFKQRNQIGKLLPFLVEENLAEDIAGLHFVAGPLDKSSQRVCAAVLKKAIMRQWLEALKTAGIEPYAMVPDMLALPDVPGAWSMLYDGRMVVLRTGACEGFSAEPAIMTHILESLLKERPAPPECVNCYITQETGSEKAALFLDIQRRHGPLQFKAHAVKSLLDFQTETHPFPTAVFDGEMNLLQGEFRPQALRPAAPEKWFLLAGAFVAWFFALLLLSGGESLYLSHEAGKLNEDTVVLYQQLFPQDKKIVDPVLQMRNHLALLQSAHGGGFLSLLGRLASFWPTEYHLEVESMNYRDESHDLMLDITAKDAVAIDQLAQRLNDKGLKAKIISTTNGSYGVKGQLIVGDTVR